MFWCGYKGKKEKKVVWPKETKVQQSSAWSGEPESAAKEEIAERRSEECSKC